MAKILSQEFDDISISKIRYLEDQKLLSPRRTQGGYRLYSQADVERLQAILRMQRDEFLPLRVIRQELSTGSFTGRRPSGEGSKRRAGSVDAPVTSLTRETWSSRRASRTPSCASCRSSGSSSRSGATAAIAYDETDLEIVRAAAELSRSGSRGATCASSGPPPTARPRCSSS